MSKSIIHPKFEGTLILISGLHGLGKTTLAATMENPALTGMIDFDLKGRALAQDLKMASYNSPEHIGSPDDYDVKALAEWFIKTLNTLPSNLTHLIIDNATWAEAGLAWRVLQNPAKYGVNAKNAQAGIYGGANPGITVLWANIFGYLQNRGVKVVTVINHMSQPWIDGKPAPNKFNVKGNKVFNQIASLAVILTPANPKRGGKPPIPSGLIIKEALSLTRWNDDTSEFSTVKALPARLPVCTWKKITGYLENPADFANPTPGEEWTQDEVNSYSEWLSPEQVQWVMKVKSYSDEDETPQQETPRPVVVEQPKNGQAAQPESKPAKGKLTRPMTPEQVKSAADVKSARFTGKPGEKQADYAFSSLNSACGKDDLRRHTVTLFLFGKESSKDLTSGECSFLIDWIGAKAENEYTPDENAVKEIEAIIAEWQRQQGQVDMFGQAEEIPF